MDVINFVPIVLGPTAVGKTDIVHRIAADLDGEVVSADSRAVYKYMSIGTDTPPEEYRGEINYHLINFIHPKERYSAADFARDAEEAIFSIKAKGKNPIVVGGSRLYIKALTQGIFDGPSADEKLREKLRARSGENLHDELAQVDPTSASKIHPNDKKRLVRALEVYRLTGEPISKLKEEAEPLPFNFRKIGLIRDRDQLYERIDNRVDLMVQEGLIEEVEALMEKGFSPDWGAWETIGYKEIANYLNGELELDQAIQRIKYNTHDLARYQSGWIESEDHIKIIDLTDIEVDRGAKKVLETMESFE